MLMDKIRWFGLQTELNVYKTVQKIRQSRKTMVQTFEQYKFIYDAVACYVSAEKAKINTVRGMALKAGGNRNKR